MTTKQQSKGAKKTKQPRALRNGKVPTYEDLLLKYAPRPIRSQADYRRMLKIAQKLTRPKLSKDESLFLDLVAGLIVSYETEKFPGPDLSPGEVLASLIELRGMTQAQLAREVGISKQMITDILKGQRSITTEHLTTLAKYFHVSPAVFLPG